MLPVFPVFHTEVTVNLIVKLIGKQDWVKTAYQTEVRSFYMHSEQNGTTCVTS